MSYCCTSVVEFDLAVLGCTEMNWEVLGCGGLYVVDCTRRYWAVLGTIGLFSAALGCTGLY